MKVYIAAPSELQNSAKTLRKYLVKRGFEVSADWIDLDLSLDRPESKILDNLMTDLYDIRSCDLFILLNPESFRYKGTGGRHFETGYANALGKRILIAGVKSNIFHEWPTIIHSESIMPEDIYATLRAEFVKV